MKIQRRYGWIKNTPEEHKALGRPYRATRFKAVQYPQAFDLNTPPNAAFGSLDQGQLGACTAFAMTRCAWYGLNALATIAEQPTAPQPAPLFQYQGELTLDGDFGQDNGSSIAQSVNSLKQFGIPPESEWPYNPANFTVKAPPQVFADAQKFAALAVENLPVDQQAIMDCLFNARLPIAFGSDLFEQFDSGQCEQDGLVQMPPVGATPIGGHAEVICGWKPAADKTLLLKVKNSWSDSWGDKGFAWFPWNYALKYFSDLWAIVTMK